MPLFWATETVLPFLLIRKGPHKPQMKGGETVKEVVDAWEALAESFEKAASAQSTQYQSLAKLSRFTSKQNSKGTCFASTGVERPQ